MSFANPWGLLVLLGIPVLVAMHLLRPRAKEASVSSLYLWKRSVSFQKRRRRSHQLRMLVLMLQLMLVAACALVAAVPTLMLPVSVSSRIVILDASASMNAAYNEQSTRFEHAASLIVQQMRQQGIGIETTVLTAAPEITVLAEKAVSAAEVERALQHAVCGWEEDSFDSALAYAQKLLRKGDHAEVVLYTDADYPASENLIIHNVAPQPSWNAAITDASIQRARQGTSVSTTVVSYGADAELTLALYVDEALHSALEISCTADEAFPAQWSLPDITDYDSIRICIVEAQDALAADNVWRFTDSSSERIQALLTGSPSIYMTEALRAFDRVELQTMERLPEVLPEGFDLYVLEGDAPSVIPEQAAVWLIDPPDQTEALSAMGLAWGERLQGTRLTLADSAASTAPELQERLGGAPFAVQQFREITAVGLFEPVLNCGYYPVVLAGQAESGARRILMSFDLRRSNLPLQSAFIYLLDNMLRYTSPSMLSRHSYTTSDTVQAAILPTCEKAMLILPDGSSRILSLSGSSIDLELTQPGAYTLVQQCAQKLRKDGFFVTVPDRERQTAQTVREEALAVNQATANTAEAIPLNPHMLLVMLAMILLVLESGVYHHEQI